MAFSFAQSILAHKKRLAGLKAKFDEAPNLASRLAYENQVKRRFLYLRQKGRCCFCQSMTFLDFSGCSVFFKGFMATTEHVIPRSLGGSDDISNLKMSCHNCNTERGVIDFDRFMDRRGKGVHGYPRLTKKHRQYLRKKKAAREKLERYINDPVYREKVDAYSKQFPQLTQRFKEVTKEAA